MSLLWYVCHGNWRCACLLADALICWIVLVIVTDFGMCTCWLLVVERCGPMGTDVGMFKCWIERVCHSSRLVFCSFFNIHNWQIYGTYVNTWSNIEHLLILICHPTPATIIQLSFLYCTRPMSLDMWACSKHSARSECSEPGFGYREHFRIFYFYIVYGLVSFQNPLP